jgi:uncharacterized membrane protein
MLQHALSIASLLAFILFSCKHDPFVDPANPVANTPCDPDSVYFQNQILPILVSNCTQSGCHNAQDHQEGVVLDSYQSLLQTVEKVTNNDWNKNKLMKVIRDDDPGDRMPPAPNNALTQEQINLIGAWVNQGAQNNICDENFGNCDPNTGTFASFVQPLVQARCQGCHSSNSPQGNLKLSSYNEIKTVALNGKLYASLTRPSNWMPSGGAKLDDCTLQKIQFWIDSGAPQN